METVREVCQYIGSLLDAQPVCIETGTTYTCAPGNEIHTTTNNIYEHICIPLDGTFYSLDIDPEHQQFAVNMLEPLYAEAESVRMKFIEGDSVESLWHLNRKGLEVDLLCLDSKEFDEDHMVNEYNTIKGSLRPDKHFVLVDDIHNPNSVKYKKAVPLLQDLGYKGVEIPTPTGLYVFCKGYDLP